MQKHIQRLPPETVWIIGGGQFGARAVRQLQSRSPETSFVVVDPAPSSSLPDDITLILEDGITWLADHFTRNAKVDKIVPALPLHMLAGWLTEVLTAQGKTVIPLSLDKALFPESLHPFQLGPGQVALSHADFLCPPDCPEPRNICTYTGLPRPTPMYTILESLKYQGVTPLILKSRQFAPGVGGFFPRDMLNFLNRLEPLEETPLLIGTACKCHGIVDSLRHKSTGP